MEHNESSFLHNEVNPITENDRGDDIDPFTEKDVGDDVKSRIKGTQCIYKPHRRSRSTQCTSAVPRWTWLTKRWQHLL
jgi:hypothetical protein